MINKQMKSFMLMKCVWYSYSQTHQVVRAESNHLVDSFPYIKDISQGSDLNIIFDHLPSGEMSMTTSL